MKISVICLFGFVTLIGCRDMANESLLQSNATSNVADDLKPRVASPEQLRALTIEKEFGEARKIGFAFKSDNGMYFVKTAPRVSAQGDDLTGSWLDNSFFFGDLQSGLTRIQYEQYGPSSETKRVSDFYDFSSNLGTVRAECCTILSGTSKVQLEFNDWKDDGSKGAVLLTMTSLIKSEVAELQAKLNDGQIRMNEGSVFRDVKFILLDKQTGEYILAARRSPQELKKDDWSVWIGPPGNFRRLRASKVDTKDVADSYRQVEMVVPDLGTILFYRAFDEKSRVKTATLTRQGDSKQSTPLEEIKWDIVNSETLRPQLEKIKIAPLADFMPRSFSVTDFIKRHGREQK